MGPRSSSMNAIVNSTGCKVVSSGAVGISNARNVPSNRCKAVTSHSALVCSRAARGAIGCKVVSTDAAVVSNEAEVVSSACKVISSPSALARMHAIVIFGDRAIAPNRTALTPNATVIISPRTVLPTKTSEARLRK